MKIPGRGKKKKITRVRVYTDDTNFTGDILIKKGKEYYTKETDLKIGTFNQKALIRDEEGDYFLSIYSPDGKKVVIITNDFLRKAHNYLIPDITNLAINKIEGIQEEVFLKRFLDKHAKEIFFFLSIFFIFLIVTNLNGQIKDIGVSLGGVKGSIDNLATVFNSTRALPIN